ncbi:DUF5305 domain-containing protein [Saliphagus sp. LR7]|uniref:DUF5305 domain-containing protein n=1 Tax=Saliphagus sp. LR7 TaxID=2282654 RepID=UPI000DF7D760|nr:DUF5305 domain-containing protein [Saliphagus sp. LR7]
MIDNPRIDLLVARHGRAIAIAAVAVGVLAVLATGWAAANPQTTTAPAGVAEDRVETEVATSAEVVRDGLWESGTELRDNPLYTRNDTPVVAVEPRTTVPEDSEVTVDHVVSIRYEAVRDETVFWEDGEEVLNETVTAEGGVATSSAEIDVESVADRREAIEADLGDVGTVALSVVVDVRYSGDLDGGYELSTPLAMDEEAYWFEESMSESVSHDRAAGAETTEPRSTLVAGFGLLALAAFGVAAIVARRGTVDPDVARRRLHERRHAEWISHGTIPMWIGDHHVALDTLEDVVDVAIDTNERVVHDRDRELFAVVSDDVVYYYSERGLWEETAWPDFDLQSGERPPMPDDAGGRTARPPEIDGGSPALEGDGSASVPGGTDPASDDDSLPDPDDDDAWEQL